VAGALSNALTALTPINRLLKKPRNGPFDVIRFRSSKDGESDAWWGRAE
jgi:hypothetical protein